MKMRNRLLTLGILLATFSFAILNGLSAQEPDQLFEFHKPASMWPKGDYVIIPTAKSRRNRSNVEHLGPTGLWGFRCGQNICVLRVDPGSPADGKVLLDDFIYGANGKEFTDDDPRRHFAKAITEAETKEAGGKLVLHIRRNGKLGKVSIRLQVMGSFSPTTPWNCEKSKKIVARAEEYMLKGLRPEKGAPQNSKYMYNPFYDSVLFLMASGNPKLQGLVRRQIHLVLKQIDDYKLGKKGGLSIDKGWTPCYLAMVLGEYYHFTGDRTVIPYIETICNRTLRKKGEPIVPWSPPSGPSQYGLHPHQQMPATIGLVLANEAGLNINKKQLLFDLNYLYYKRAEYGYVKYCGYPKITVEGRQTHGPKEITEGQKAVGTYSSMNGKLGAAATLYSLVDGYEKAVNMCSVRSVYAFNTTNGGHGGVWFNGFWTPIGAYQAGPKKCQLFMKGQQWWRELYRDHTGSMWQMGNAKGKGDTLGTGFAIHRVMHEKRLRILGAPRSMFTPSAPAYMKPALAAHRKRDYAGAEKLAKQLLESGKVPAAEKARVSHFLESVQILRKSIEHDLTFTATLLKKGNYVLASFELPQLQMVVPPGNSRLKAIARAVGSSKAKTQMAAVKAQADKNWSATMNANRAARGSRKENFENELARLVTLVKDSVNYLGPYFGRRGRGTQGRYPSYPKNEANRWRLQEVQTLKDAPKGWEQATFDDSKWKVAALPIRTKRNAKPVLLRTHFEVKDVSAFEFLRIRMKAGGIDNLTIYLNGGIVAVGDRGFEQVIRLNPGALALLRKGKNTLAIGAHRSGGTSITVRLEGVLKSPQNQKKSPKSQKGKKRR